MERALSIMLALCMVFICMPDNAFMKADAVTNYGISIGSVKVTSENASDILGDGNFKYDHSKKTLSIKGIYTGDIFNSENNNLIIDVVGDCTVTGQIWCGVSTTITGDYPLILKKNSSAHSGAFRVVYDLTKLTIKDADITVTNEIWGSEYKTSLEIINSNITVSNSIYGFNNGITLTDCYIKSPTTASVKDDRIDRGGNYEPFEILRGDDPNPKYGFKIDSLEVDSNNAADILGDGVLSYDAESNTLTVNGDVSDKYIYNYSCNGLIINPVKDCTIYVLNASVDTVLTGWANVTGKNTWKTGAKLTIKNTVFKGSIEGTNDDAALCVENAIVQSNSITRLKGGITLIDCQIVKPAETVIKDGTVYKSDGTTVARDITINNL